MDGQNFMQDSQYISATGAQGFVSHDEVVVAGLKNGVMLNLISGEGFTSEDAVVTNKRLYYTNKTGIINISRREEMVDLKDITGTKILKFNPVWLLVCSIIVALCSFIFIDESPEAMIAMLSAGVVWLIVYFCICKSYLRIEYAGGSINFSVKKYGLNNIRAFQRHIHAAKERM